MRLWAPGCDDHLCDQQAVRGAAAPRLLGVALRPLETQRPPGVDQPTAGTYKYLVSWSLPSPYDGRTGRSSSCRSSVVSEEIEVLDNEGAGVKADPSADQASVLVTSSHGVRIITISRPQKRNAIDRPTALALAAAFDDFDADDAFSVAILTGAGGYFSAGADLVSVSKGELPVLEGRGFAGITRRTPTKPVIAAVEGFAFAGGFELALACDLIVASSAASFALPEARRGLVAAGGGLLRLPDRIPYYVAMELALLGEPIGAARLADLGLVNRLTEPGQALETAIDLAGKIALSGPIATRTAKRIISASRYAGTEDQFAIQESIVAPLRGGPEAQEGARAFVERREPSWVSALKPDDDPGR